MDEVLLIGDAPAELVEAARHADEDFDFVRLAVNGRVVGLVPARVIEFLEAWEDAHDVIAIRRDAEEARRGRLGPAAMESFLAELSRLEGLPPEEAERSWMDFDARYRIVPRESDGA